MFRKKGIFKCTMQNIPPLINGGVQIFWSLCQIAVLLITTLLFVNLQLRANLLIPPVFLPSAKIHRAGGCPKGSQKIEFTKFYGNGVISEFAVANST